ncbi:hypothetical protein AB0F17_34220 [Nonomuraea sp. NPDC026600]
MSYTANSKNVGSHDVGGYWAAARARRSAQRAAAHERIWSRLRGSHV